MDKEEIANAIIDADLPFMKLIAKERRNEACFDIATVIYDYFNVTEGEK